MFYNFILPHHKHSLLSMSDITVFCSRFHAFKRSIDLKICVCGGGGGQKKTKSLERLSQQIALEIKALPSLNKQMGIIH